MSRLVDVDLFISEFSKVADKHRDNVAMSIMFDVFMDALKTFPVYYDTDELNSKEKVGKNYD